MKKYNLIFLIIILLSSINSANGEKIKIYANDENIEELLSIDPDNVDFLSLYAFKLRRNDQLYDALKTYKKIIKLDDSNNLAYLELAEIYYELHNYNEAKKYFLKIYKRDIPNNLKFTIRNYLKSISKFNPSKITYNFSIGYNDNINNGTYVDTIRIFGLPFDVNESSKSKKSYELYSNINYSNFITIKEQKLNTKVKIFNSDYQNDDYDRLKYQFIIGPEYIINQNKINIDLIFSEDLVSNQSQSIEHQIDINNLINTKANLQFNFNTGVIRKKYQDNYDYNSEISYFGLKSYINKFEKTKFLISGSVFDSNANTKKNGYFKNSLSAYIEYKLPISFISTLGIKNENTKYKDRSFLWQKTRNDVLNSTSLTFRNEKFIIGNLVPQLQFFNNENKSNIDLYKYRTNGFSISLVSEF